MKTKTLLIAGSSSGGNCTTVAVAHLADALRAIGYKVRLADCDTANRSLSRIDPDAVPVDLHETTSLENFLSSIPTGSDDITLMDSSGGSAYEIAEYFDSNQRASFEAQGIRIVAGIAVLESDYSLLTGSAWYRQWAFGYDSLLLVTKNHQSTGNTFNIKETPIGSSLFELNKGKMIEIPQLSQMLRQTFHQSPALPSMYLKGGPAAEKLNLNRLESAMWENHHKLVIESVEPYSEWLTGKPIPTSHYVNVQKSKQRQGGILSHHIETIVFLAQLSGARNTAKYLSREIGTKITKKRVQNLLAKVRAGDITITHGKLP